LLLAVAWAAQAKGIFCNVVVPEHNNPELNNSTLAIFMFLEFKLLNA